MKWLKESKPDIDYSKWHPVFAWKPIRIGKHMLWLETIYCRAIFDDQKFLNITEMNHWIKDHGDVDWEFQEGVLYP